MPRPCRPVALAVFAGLSFVPAVSAFAQNGPAPCEDFGIGLTTLVQPIEANSLKLYDGQVIAYNIDTIEPAAAAAGIAVVLPDVDDPLGGAKCLAVTGLGAVDVTKARRSYDPQKGLLLVLATSRLDEDGTLVAGPTLRLRIDLRASSLTAE